MSGVGTIFIEAWAMLVYAGLDDFVYAIGLCGVIGAVFAIFRK